MSKIYNYKDFLNEKFFKRFFKKVDEKEKSVIEKAIEEIIEFLNSNGLYTWDDLLNAKVKERSIIDTIIDTYIENKSELKEIIFGLRLELSNDDQLRQWIKDLEEKEEYERCHTILKKINKK